jgi:hypothetical protein
MKTTAMTISTTKVTIWARISGYFWRKRFERQLKRRRKGLTAIINEHIAVRRVL